MQTKQFTGDTIDDVLGKVRGEFGDEAVILETRNVVRGGIGGFFGRSGIEVTAADRMPATGGTGGVDVLDDHGSDSVGRTDDDGRDDFLRRLGEHLAPSGGATRGAPTAAPLGTSSPNGDGAEGERDRARAIIEAARAAVREAGADRDTETATAVSATDDGPPVVPPAIRAEESPPAAVDSAVAGAEAFSGPPLDEGTVAPAARPLPLNSEVAALREELVTAGVDERRIEGLLEGFTRTVAPFLDGSVATRAAVRDYLAARLPVVRDWRPWRAAHTIALVGQTGVGKSTTALKVAACHARAGKNVALIGAAPGSQGSLIDGARALDITLIEAGDPTAIARAIDRLGDRDLIVLDTPGCAHRANGELDALRTLVDAARTDEVHLVLAAATPSDDLGDLHGAFRPVGVNRVTLTKLDETRHFGALLNAPMRLGRPLAYIADGPTHRGGITPGDPRLVAELLLP